MFFKHLPTELDTSCLANADLFVFAFIYCLFYNMFFVI